MIADRALDGVAFIPVFVTLAGQLFAFVVVWAVIGKASGRLDLAGLSVDQREFALQVMQEFALLVQLFTGGLAVLVALQLTAAATHALGRGWAIGIACATVVLYSGLAVVGLVWDQLYEPITDHPEVRLPWYDRLVVRLGMKDYGTLLTWVVIALTFAAQVLTAFLGLPVASTTGPKAS